MDVRALPDGVLLLVFSLLDDLDLTAVERVCKRWRGLANDPAANASLGLRVLANVQDRSQLDRSQFAQIALERLQEHFPSWLQPLTLSEAAAVLARPRFSAIRTLQMELVELGADPQLKEAFGDSDNEDVELPVTSEAWRALEAAPKSLEKLVVAELREPPRRGADAPDPFEKRALLASLLLAMSAPGITHFAINESEECALPLFMVKAILGDPPHRSLRHLEAGVLLQSPESAAELLALLPALKTVSEVECMMEPGSLAGAALAAAGVRCRRLHIFAHMLNPALVHAAAPLLAREPVPSPLGAEPEPRVEIRGCMLPDAWPDGCFAGARRLSIFECAGGPAHVLGLRRLVAGMPALRRFDLILGPVGNRRSHSEAAPGELVQLLKALGPGARAKVGVPWDLPSLPALFDGIAADPALLRADIELSLVPPVPVGRTKGPVNVPPAVMEAQVRLFAARMALRSSAVGGSSA